MICLEIWHLELIPIAPSGSLPPRSDCLQGMPFNDSSHDKHAFHKSFMDNMTQGLPKRITTSATAESHGHSPETTSLSQNDQSLESFSPPMHEKDYCTELIQGTNDSRLMEWAAHHRLTTEEEMQYINAVLKSCDDFLRLADYIQKPLNFQEESFPIAYAIVVYKDPWQIERLLHAIYRPQNHYCIHVDSKVSKLNL